MIIRIKKCSDNPFVMIHKHLINDKDLSLKEKGLMCFLLSKPDDWQIYTKQLSDDLKESQNTICKIINSLIKKSYIERKQLRQDGTGHFKSYEYIIYESPNHKNPHTVKPNSNYCDNTNIDLTNNDLTKNNDNAIFSKEKNCTLSLREKFKNYLEENNTIDIPSKLDILDYYMNLYKLNMGEEHPNLKEDQVARIADVIFINKIIDGFEDMPFEDENLYEMIDNYFQTDFKRVDVDYNLNHFATKGILTRRYYQACY